MFPEAANETPKTMRKHRDRVYERFSLGSVPANLVYKGISYPCQAIDISIGGCCLRLEQPFPDGALASVNLALSIFGIRLRIGGVTQWIRGDNMVGVRFIHPSARSKNQLASFLTCLVDQTAADFVREALAAAPSNSAVGAILVPEPIPGEPVAPVVAQPQEQDTPAEEPTSEEEQFKMVEATQEELNLKLEDSPAHLHLLNPVVDIHGSVIELHSEGCRFRTAAKFQLDLYSRVELHLRFRGLQLKLPAVVSEICDAHTAAVRFLGLSERKHEQLGEILAELVDGRADAA